MKIEAGMAVFAFTILSATAQGPGPSSRQLGAGAV
jgi:hypothetical protein